MSANDGELPIAEQIAALPECPGVYLFQDAEGRLLYIGKSVKLRTRVRSYFRPNGGHTRRTGQLKNEATAIAYRRCGSELEALIVESRLIKRLNPLYNVLGRVGRHYPFIKVPSGPFPRVELSYELVEDGGRYFGPFPSEYRAREALDALRPLFRWRSCNPMPKSVCFEHSIGRCSAPCVGRVDAAAYAEQMAELEVFLTGGGGKRLAAIQREMEAAAEALEFERARVLRDRLQLLRPIVGRQAALQTAISELDCLVVLPAAEAGKFLWLVIRRGRLTASHEGVTTRQRVRMGRALSQALAVPAPGLTVLQGELDEINMLSSWLYKHRWEDNVISLADRRVEDAVEEAFAAMRSQPARLVAERPAQRVERGPKKP